MYMYVLDWCIICTGLSVLNWTGGQGWCIGLVCSISCCMYSTGILYERGWKGWGIAPATLLKWEGGGGGGGYEF